MKFFFLLLSFLATLTAAQDCGDCPVEEGFVLERFDCTGFKVRRDAYWSDRQVKDKDGECGDAEDSEMFNDNYLCCATDTSFCCEDYPTGFIIGFVVGIGGIGIMLLYAVYVCFCAPKAEVKEIEE
jgi:hypothetical protein